MTKKLLTLYSLTEEDLGLLFNNLPRRCVVLLEDIDSAGLIRRENEPEPTSEPDSGTTESSKKEANVGVEIAKALKSANDKNSKDRDANKGISLSGLLNAIDGVASHEGRVLVMTTNFPEKLDEALIRPGRVDMKVAFTMASRNQIRQLFIRMYTADNNDIAKRSQVAAQPKVTAILNSHPASANGNAKGSLTPTLAPARNLIPEAELADIANTFANCLPEATFTPAEIQGFLLTRKKEPRRALEEVETWKESCLAAKATKSKLAPS